MQLVTSGKTEETFDTGVDNDMELFLMAWVEIILKALAAIVLAGLVLAPLFEAIHYAAQRAVLYGIRNWWLFRHTHTRAYVLVIGPFVEFFISVFARFTVERYRDSDFVPLWDEVIGKNYGVVTWEYGWHYRIRLYDQA